MKVLNMRAVLIEPDGREGKTVTVNFAIQFCNENPDWFWEEVDDEKLVEHNGHQHYNEDDY